MLINLAEKVWKKMPYKLRLVTARSLQKRFTISVAAVVLNKKQEVLVLNHYFRLRYSWGLPGGFINHYEQPIDGLQREILEETNLSLRKIEFVQFSTAGKHLEILFKAEGFGEIKNNSDEIKEIGWISPDNLPKMSPDQIKLIRNIM